MEKRMICVSLRDKKEEEWVGEQTRVNDVIAEIKKKKGAWAGHVKRKQDNRWSLRVRK